MGLEARGELTVGTETFPVKALLESRELIVRSDFRKTFALSEIATPAVEGNQLLFSHQGADYALVLPAGQAVKWLKKLTTPPPSLAAKLGIGPDSKALVIGTIDDAALAEAFGGATTDDPTAAVCVVVIASAPAELAFPMADLPVWIVYPKGAKSPLPEAVVRSHMHALGYADTKTSAVSDRLTALRFHRRKAV